MNSSPLPQPRPGLPHRSRLYSDLAGVYDHVFKGVFSRRIASVIRQLDIPPGARVLEVGVGTGLSLDAYPGHCEVTGIDLSGPMLEQARRKLDPHRHSHIQLLEMDAMAMQLPVEHFDYVTAFHVVTVVPDPQRLVAAMARACKDDGTIVMINHFSSPRKVLRGMVNLVDPLTRKLGWSTRLSLTELVDGRLDPERVYKTSPWSLFTVVEARKSGGSVDVRTLVDGDQA
jgi:phosphatidylethanolamine/phosphatidyl-N-methylethanolamine N-methyltransferase